MVEIDKSLSFENALQELERIVRQLEDEKFSLEDAIVAYERGIALRAHCEEILHKARMKIERISESAEKFSFEELKQKIEEEEGMSIPASS